MSSVVNCLVIDDSKLSRMILCKIISTHYAHWNIVEAADARQGIELAQQQDFELITLDHNMPGITGLDAYPQLKELQPNALIGIFSANIQQSLKLRAQEQGVEFINKPINEQKVLDFVQKLSSLQD
ncbi:MAG: response regulator [Gammaproteobacteria bacterium]|nr:response regulator [Gammaproteobacteria bacterium]